MNILQVFNRYLQPGGEEKSVDRIFGHLGGRHRVGRCFFDSREWRSEPALKKLTQPVRLIHNRSSAQELRRAIARNEPDVLLFHNIYPVGSPALYHAALKAGVPVIQFAHNYRPFSVGGTLWAGGRLCAESIHGHYGAEISRAAWQGSRAKSLLFACALKWLHASGWLKAVKAWVGISGFVREKFVEAGLPAERVFALRHSWDAMDNPPAPRDNGHYLLLCRLVEEKGIAVAIEAWDRLVERFGERAPKLVLGGNGPLEGLAAEAAARNPRIDFIGYADDARKRALLESCRAVVAPVVWWEPLGLVTYEAYDFGKPVVAAASGAFTETVRDGATGLLHAPGDADDLAAKVADLEARSPAERRDMGAAGRAWLLEDAHPSRWMERFEEILGTVVTVPRAPGER